MAGSGQETPAMVELPIWAACWSSGVGAVHLAGAAGGVGAGDAAEAVAATPRDGVAEALACCAERWCSNVRPPATPAATRMATASTAIGTLGRRLPLRPPSLRPPSLRPTSLRPTSPWP